jgi:hypothetical protein
MLSKQLFLEKSVSLSDLFPNFTHEFLEPFKDLATTEIKHEMHLDFEIVERKHHNKISPILQLAKPEDAEEITEIYKSLYEGTYPYKEMEDADEVRAMIESPTCEWVLFKDKSGTNVGCFTFVLDIVDKKGYIRGLMVKKEFQGKVDVIKAAIGSYIGMYSKYRDRIFRWYCENRTAHAKSQYALSIGGIKPIAFYPNKDIFNHKIESDIMHICYDERALREYRSSVIPKVIPQVKSCFNYSNMRYNIGSCHIESPKICLNKAKVRKLQNYFQKNVERDKFGYENITYSFENSRSYFEFLYTPTVQNFEKTKYKVKNLEELYVFIQEFLRCKNKLNVRYCEIFLSAYKPSHQQIFFEAGFIPQGYIPSWKWSSKSNTFKDSILFSKFDGKICENIKLIEQGQKLVQSLGLMKFSEAGKCIETYYDLSTPSTSSRKNNILSTEI